MPVAHVMLLRPAVLSTRSLVEATAAQGCTHVVTLQPRATAAVPDVDQPQPLCDKSRLCKPESRPWHFVSQAKSLQALANNSLTAYDGSLLFVPA